MATVTGPEGPVGSISPVTGEHDGELDLRRHVRSLARRWKVVVLVIVVLTGSTLLASLRQTPLYEGTARVLLKPSSQALLTGTEGEESAGGTRRVNNEIELFSTNEIRAEVERQLGPHRPAEVSQIGDTDVLAIKGRDPSPGRAAAVAKAYAVAYVDLRRDQEAAALAAAADRVQRRVDDLQAQIDGASAELVAEEQRQRANPPGISVSSQRIVGLNAERDYLLTQQAPLKQRLDQLELEADATTGGVQLVNETMVPVVKVQPRPLRSALVGLGLGGVLGFGLAFLLAFLDDSLKNREDIDRAVPGVPVLTLIPHVQGNKGESPLAVARTDPRSPAGEAFSGLRTSLQFLKATRAPHVFQITSARAAEGKTSVAANLGVVLARSGLRVAMVDCDLRRPKLHEPFGLSCTVGFTSVFLGEVDVDSATQSVPEIEGLALLAAGPVPPNAPEVVSARRTAEILGALRSKYDAVVVDSPPALPVADPIALSAWVDATILVVREGRTSRRDLARVVELLTQAEAPLVGVVLNDVPAEEGYGYQYASRPSLGPSSVATDDAATRAFRNLSQPGGKGKD